MSRRRKILIVAGIALGVVILIPVIHHYQLRFAVESYLAQLKAKGEPMELAQVIPPSVPPEQNSADTFRAAVELFEADKSMLGTNYVYGMKMVASGKAMVHWQQPDIRDADFLNPDGTISWEDMTSAVAQNGKSFALLQQIIEKPNFDFQIKYEQGVADLNFTNFYLAQSKRAAQRLSSAVFCDLHRGDTASAVKNLRAMLALVKAMRDERLVISELVRIAIAQIALSVNWEILQSPNLTDEQLAELQNDWKSLDFIRGDENALAMEHETGEISLAKWRSSNSSLEHYFDIWETSGLSNQKENIFDKFKLGTKIFLWRHWWSYPDELRTLKGYEVLLATTHSVETNFSLLATQQEQERQLQRFGITNDEDTVWFGNPKKINFHFMLSSSVVSLGRIFDKVIKAEVTKQVTIIAIALKRYQFKHGNYPADLNSLVPEFVSTVPIDPVDGQPLRYRPNTDGTFLLYSVGENGVDDGGDPSLEKGVNSSSFYWQNAHALDWVWPQPATAEEIQKYYEEQAKKSK